MAQLLWIEDVVLSFLETWKISRTGRDTFILLNCLQRGKIFFFLASLVIAPPRGYECFSQLKVNKIRYYRLVYRLLRQFGKVRRHRRNGIDKIRNHADGKCEQCVVIESLQHIMMTECGR